MAKTKLSEVLKLVFGSKLDEEIDLDLNETSTNTDDDPSKKDESTNSENKEDDKSDSKEVEKKDNTSEKKDNKDVETDVTKVDNTEVIKLFEDGWFDETTGKVDFDKIKNEEALSAIKVLTGKYQAEKEQRLINDSLNDTLKEYSLNVSEDTLRKVLDTSGVKIDDEGKVVGVKEALESLKKSEPGFFKDKEKESSPLNEGFNPVDKQTTLTEDEVVNLAYGQTE